MSLDRALLYFDHVTLSVAVDKEPGRGSRADLWPSIGEYPCYDSFLYSSMKHDSVRNAQFAAALELSAAGRHVLDIGTGQELHWALVAARAGARRVTAIEAIPRSYENARKLLDRLPESDIIDLVEGYSTDVHLEDRADVCVAEVIGSIASSEGILAVIADARRRLLRDDAIVIPLCCTTKIGAVCLRDMFPKGLAFSADSMTYLERVFEFNGGPFDVRLAVANPPASAVVSTAATVEVLDFNAAAPQRDETSEVRLHILRDGAVDGLLCWITLLTHSGGGVVDTLRQRTSWVPVYLPLFDTPQTVHQGEVLEVKFDRLPAGDGVHPDYRVSALLGSSRSAFLSPYQGGALATAAVYEELLKPEDLP